MQNRSIYRLGGGYEVTQHCLVLAVPSTISQLFLNIIYVLVFELRRAIRACQLCWILFEGTMSNFGSLLDMNFV
jgi:hypothetical protein